MLRPKFEPGSVVYVGSDGPYEVVAHDAYDATFIRIRVELPYTHAREISVPKHWCHTQPLGSRGVPPGARDTDRRTSHDGFDKVQVRADSQRHYLLREFGQYQNLTAYDAVRASAVVSEDSCYWKRVSELHQMGLIRVVEDDFGNPLTRKGKHDAQREVYEITTEGRHVLMGLDA